MTDPDTEADAALARYAVDLAEAIDAAVPGWVERSIRTVAERQGIGLTDEAVEQAGAAAEAARSDGSPRTGALLATDIDAQVGSPLAVLRSLVGYPTEVLRAAGAVPVARDEFSVRSFPDDVYDLAPASFADVDSALHAPGMAWGAAKAYVHLSRRRSEGKI
jgi:hypothetical protein